MFFIKVFSMLVVVVVCYAQDNTRVKGDLPDIRSELLRPATKDCLRQAKSSDLLVVHYEGFFENGTKFDSSIDRPGAHPFQFQLGLGQVIQGWERGFLGMCPGEKKKVFIPSTLAYGEHGSGDIIPPNSNLIFEIELLQIHDGPKPPNVFKMIDIDSDRMLTRDELAMYLAQQSQLQGVPVDLANHQNMKVLENIFKMEDKDNDGKISHEEFSGPKHDEL